ncbi:preprotein translocase subunit SecG [Rhodalgimonas zhirmunskyi]|uniref:Protein-export membrane protein SecG n=1 Tax=Rhodalgimonas zhirmunskyi TaxID=2964767 RepID=A0AAJ1X3W9_9RHOB|nr:preprotein translocase subunit SecG [Rhodoalgimonas zhirmunskyi]MDQ2092509.1 preprotein translocase subunit SecG [Rhodoalgimonas zhirmunskyi]
MENVILIIHLLLALGLIGVVLLQRSEGGGLGMGGGGGAVSARAAATAMGKVTWILAIAFIATSITLTVIAAEKSASGSVIDRISDAPAPAADAPATGLDGQSGDSLLPPSADDGGTTPLVPKAD